jgi:hypothetical protein
MSSTDTFEIEEYRINPNTYQEEHIHTTAYTPGTPQQDTPYPGMTTYPHSVGSATWFPTGGAASMHGRVYRKNANGQRFFVQQITYQHVP